MSVIVQSNSSVTLIGAGGTDAATFATALALAPVLVAADGGANVAFAFGHDPEAVIGDLDSLDDALRARLGARVHHIPDQDSTDFDKCLAAIDAPMILALGFAAARLDHTLAACRALVQNGCARVVMLGESDIVFLAPPRLELQMPVGARVSLFPFASVSGRSKGLQWPIDGIEFTPGGTIGTSNRITAGPLRLEFDQPGMVVLLEPLMLENTLSALLAAPDWPKSPLP